MSASMQNNPLFICIRTQGTQRPWIIARHRRKLDESKHNTLLTSHLLLSVERVVYMQSGLAPLATLYEFVEAGDLIFLSPEMVACHEAVNW